MTMRQFRKAIEAIDKNARIINGDLYEDEVTPEGHKKAFLGIVEVK